MSDSINTVVVFVAGSSFAFSALFYNLYQKKKEELIKLKASISLILCGGYTDDVAGHFDRPV